jgi:hypothetical protein
MTRRLDDFELLAFIGLLSPAGNETVARLLGWTGATLARFPGERRKLVRNPGLIPNGIEELLRYEAPSPVQARWGEGLLPPGAIRAPQGATRRKPSSRWPPRSNLFEDQFLGESRAGMDKQADAPPRPDVGGGLQGGGAHQGDAVTADAVHFDRDCARARGDHFHRDCPCGHEWIEQWT